MKVFYDPSFYKKLKKVDVRIRKSVKEKILIFSKNPNDLQLNNHPLKREYEGYRSIDVTEDWRALYKEVQIANETIAYFTVFGTHDELYGKSEKVGN